MSELEHCRLAHEGKIDLLKKILQDDNKLAIKKDQSGRTIIHWAASGGHLDVINLANTYFNVPLDDQDECGWSPLMIAASAGHLNVVQFLINEKCDVNCKNNNKQTPLHYACSRDRVEIAKLLLDNGAVCNVFDIYGHTPLHRAASKGYLKLVNMLIVDYKASVNATDNEGNSPLHAACEEERVEVVKFLLKHGANPYLKNKDEKTPIDASNGGLLYLLNSQQS